MTNRHTDFNHRPTLIKLLGSSAITKLVFTGFGLINTILLAKILGPAQMGIYSFAMAIVGFLAIPAQLGIPTLATKHIAVYFDRNDWSKMKGFFRRSHQAIVILSLALMLLTCLVLLILGNIIAPEKLHTLFLSLVLIPLLALNALRAGLLKGLHHVILGLIPEEIIRPVTFFTLIIMVTLASNEQVNSTFIIGMQVVAFC